VAGASFSLSDGGAVNFSDVTGEPSLDPDAFHRLINNLTASDTEEEFAEFFKFCSKAVLDAAESTSGTKLQREIWEMFRLLDTNNDGVVDLRELEVLVGPQSKKQLIRWKHYLANKLYQSSGTIPQTLSGATAPVGNDVEDEDEDPIMMARCSMTLRDFQKFVKEYVHHKEERIPDLVAAVRRESQVKQIQYIVQFRVHEVLNEIMEDLLKERPYDVLSGIRKSVDRLDRTGKYAAAENFGKKSRSYSDASHLVMTVSTA
jgi:Ca2+-binding EF-hand superfamily protein